MNITYKMETVESLKAYPPLGKAMAACAAKEDKSKNLGDHVNAIFDHIIVHCPEEALGKLEEISYLLKHQDTIAMDKFLNTNRVPVHSQPADEATKKATAESINLSKSYFKVSFANFEELLIVLLFVDRNRTR